jgi:hypothetical protein
VKEIKRRGKSCKKNVTKDSEKKQGTGKLSSIFPHKTEAMLEVKEDIKKVLHAAEYEDKQVVSREEFSFWNTTPGGPIKTVLRKNISPPSSGLENEPSNSSNILPIYTALCSIIQKF